MAKPPEQDSLTGRLKRYAQVSAGMGGFAMKAAGARLGGKAEAALAQELKAALGGLKGPIMKVAQMIATIPDALPEDFAEALATLQTNAPPMGWPFVRRRMAAELGAGWEAKFERFEHEAAHAASLGQVHRAWGADGTALACKLQYPEMASAVEADLQQLSLIFSLYKRLDTAVNTDEMKVEIGARLREELDYTLEARHMQLYGMMLAGSADVTAPVPVAPLSTQRLLTMTWLEGKPLLSEKGSPLDRRNAIATRLFNAWWIPFSRYGAIHGDPHLGNYSVRDDATLNLLDFGCIRTFRPPFVGGVIALYRALLADDRDAAVAAFEVWGFRGLKNELIDALSLWARFIYAPMLDDRARPIADGVSPGAYGRREAQTVHRLLKQHGPVTVPREFVFMDRAAIGLGSAFLHLGAELNWHDLFQSAIAGYEEDATARRQNAAFTAAGVPLP